MGTCIKYFSLLPSCLLPPLLSRRVSNTVLEKVDPQLLARHSHTLGSWVSGVREVLDKLGQEAICKLYK